MESVPQAMGIGKDFRRSWRASIEGAPAFSRIRQDAGATRDRLEAYPIFRTISFFIKPFFLEFIEGNRLFFAGTLQ